MSAEAARHGPLRRIGPLGCLTLVFVLLVGLIVTLLYAWHVAGARRAAAEVAKIRERGEPATADEMNAFYERPPASQDCTQLWLSATRAFDGPAYATAAQNLPIVGISGPIPPPGTPWPALGDVEKFLQQYATSLKQMHEAADRGGAARYPGDFHEGIAMLLPHVQAARGGARMLILEAHVRAHRGDAAGAADSIHTMFSLAGSLENEPILVSQLVRMAIDGMARQQIEDLLPHVEFADEDLRRWQADMRDIDYDVALRRSLMGERVLGLTVFHDPDGLSDGGGATILSLRLTRQEDLALYLRFMNRMVDAAERPWPAVRDEAAAIDGDLKSTIAGGGLARVRYAVTATMLPSLSAAVDSVGRNATANQAADAALAAELFRRRHGRLPANLEELVPEFLPAVPVDRFDGRPLQFTVREGECLIYSVGPDGVDGGGSLDDPGNGQSGDVGFRLCSKPAE